MGPHAPTRRLIAAVAAATLCIAHAACDGEDSIPCSDCPDMSGKWRLGFEETGTVPEGCQQLGFALPEGELEVEQVGSALRSTLMGQELSGTLYDSYDFRISGSNLDTARDAGTLTVSLSGQFVPARPQADAGEFLTGTFTGTQRSGDTSCQLSRGYEARRP